MHTGLARIGVRGREADDPPITLAGDTRRGTTAQGAAPRKKR